MVLRAWRARRVSVRDDRGVALAMAALSLVALLTIAAFAIDLGYARQTARFQQAASDTASLAGVRELPSDGSTDTTKAAAARLKAAQFAWKSLFEGSAPALPTPICSGHRCTYVTEPYTVTVGTPYTLAGSGLDPDSLVYVQACRPSETFLAGVFGGSVPTVCRSAVAKKVWQRAGAGIGILALSTSGCNIVFNGNNNNTVTGGAVASNSQGTATDPNAICSQGTGCATWDINADIVSAVGLVACASNMEGAAVLEGTGTVPDPYAHVPDTPCTDVTGFPAIVSPCASGVPTTTRTCSGSPSAILPGRYAAGCNLGGGNGAVTLTPGVYWFESTLQIRNHDVSCPTCTADNGVLLYFHSGSMDGSGNGRLNLSPYRRHDDMTTLYRGLSIYQRRGNTTTMEVGGTVGNSLGTIYAPSAAINLHGNVNRDISGMIVGASLDFDGTTVNNVVPPPGGPMTEPVIDISLVD